MDVLRLEIESLILQLKSLRPAPGSSADQTLRQLQHIRSLTDGDGHGVELAAAFSDLRGFWLHRIAWCSALSRDVEKLIIIYADLSADAGQGKRPGG